MPRTLVKMVKHFFSENTLPPPQRKLTVRAKDGRKRQDLLEFVLGQIQEWNAGSDQPRIQTTRHFI